MVLFLKIYTVFSVVDATLTGNVGRHSYLRATSNKPAPTFEWPATLHSCEGVSTCDATTVHEDLRQTRIVGCRATAARRLQMPRRCSQLGAVSLSLASSFPLQPSSFFLLSILPTEYTKHARSMFGTRPGNFTRALTRR
jgi:hypothetical protein